MRTKIGAEWLTIAETVSPQVYELIVFDDVAGNEYRILFDGAQLDHMKDRIARIEEDHANT